MVKVIAYVWSHMQCTTTPHIFGNRCVCIRTYNFSLDVSFGTKIHFVHGNVDTTEQTLYSFYELWRLLVKHIIDGGLEYCAQTNSETRSSSWQIWKLILMANESHFHGKTWYNFTNSCLVPQAVLSYSAHKHTETQHKISFRISFRISFQFFVFLIYIKI